MGYSGVESANATSASMPVDKVEGDVKHSKKDCEGELHPPEN